jgi:hypothetical protein
MNRSCFATFKDHYTSEKYKEYFPSSFIEKQLIKLRLLLCGSCIDSKKKSIMRRSINLNISQAPEPSDIKWENLEITTKQRRYRILLTTGLVAIILVVSAITLLLVSLLQNQIAKENADNFLLAKIASFGFASAISIFNFLISKIMIKFTEYERNISQSDFLLSLSIKLMIFNFINSGPVPVAVNYFSGNWDSKQILVNNAFFTFLINSIFNPIYYLVNPFHWLKAMQRNMIEKKIKEDENYLKTMTQGELNE